MTWRFTKKSSTWLSQIEDDGEKKYRARFGNFGTRNWNYERKVVVKNQGQNSVDKEYLKIVGNGKLTKSFLQETIAVSVRTSLSRIGPRILSCNKMKRKRREPEVPKEEFPVEKCYVHLFQLLKSNDASWRLTSSFGTLFGPSTAFRRDGPTIHSWSLPWHTRVMTHPGWWIIKTSTFCGLCSVIGHGRDSGRELSCGLVMCTSFIHALFKHTSLVRSDCRAYESFLVEQVFAWYVHCISRVHYGCSWRDNEIVQVPYGHSSRARAPSRWDLCSTPSFLVRVNSRSCCFSWCPPSQPCLRTKFVIEFFSAWVLLDVKLWFSAGLSVRLSSLSFASYLFCVHIECILCPSIRTSPCSPRSSRCLAVSWISWLFRIACMSSFSLIDSLIYLWMLSVFFFVRLLPCCVPKKKFLPVWCHEDCIVKLVLVDDLVPIVPDSGLIVLTCCWTVPCSFSSRLTSCRSTFGPYSSGTVHEYDATNACLFHAFCLPSSNCVLGSTHVFCNLNFDTVTALDFFRFCGCLLFCVSENFFLQPILSNVKLNLILSLVLQDTLRTILLLFCSTRFIHCWSFLGPLHSASQDSLWIWLSTLPVASRQPVHDECVWTKWSLWCPVALEMSCSFSTSARLGILRRWPSALQRWSQC